MKRDYAYGLRVYLDGYTADHCFNATEWLGYVAAKMDATPAEREQAQDAAEDTWRNEPGYSEAREFPR